RKIPDEHEPRSLQCAELVSGPDGECLLHDVPPADVGGRSTLREDQLPDRLLVTKGTKSERRIRRQKKGHEDLSNREVFVAFAFQAGIELDTASGWAAGLRVFTSAPMYV